MKSKDLQDLFRVEGYSVDITTCRAILRIASFIQTSNEMDCNEPDEDKRAFYAQRAKDGITTLNKKLAQIQANNPDQPSITYIVNGDPRGYSLKFQFPSGRYNTWGGREDGMGISTDTPREGW